MKVLQIIPDLGIAGAEVMCTHLSLDLASRPNVEVTVVSLFSITSSLTEMLENQGIKVLYLDKKLGVDISMLWKLYQIMKKEHYDVVHTHRSALQYSAPAAIMARIKVRVHTIHNVAEKDVNVIQRKLHNYLFCHHNVTPVAISPIVLNTVCREYNLPADCVPMIYNGIDLSRCQVKKDYQKGSSALKVIHVGRFQDQKNHFCIIDAIKKVTAQKIPIEVYFYGEGPLQDDCEKYVKTLNLQNYVHFCGVSDNIYPHLRDADVFILPSKYEGMPITLIEAMGTGLPIVCSAVGGMPDMIRDGVNGILINPNSDELAAALIKFHRDEIIREQCGKQALKDSVNYSVKNMTENYLRVYKID